MHSDRVDAIVIGAGVTGLTSAIRLAESGLRVLVYSADATRRTDSTASGAIWGPYIVESDAAVLRWSFDTLAVLESLAAVPEAGIELVYGMEASIEPMAMPDWVGRLPHSRQCLPGELPPGYHDGWHYRAPIIDMPRYLDYLSERLRQAGGRLERRRFHRLDEVPGAAPIVNCTGLGARELVSDPRVTPVRGQLVVLDNPGIDQFFAEFGEEAELTYYLPQGDQMILGGTAEPGRTDREIDPIVAAEIIARCAKVAPELGAARVRGHRVGLRPCRPTVRLEKTRLDGRHVVHNYGHGGSGVTLSWGCANAVRDLVS